MGAGDDLIASGMARGANARGKRIAFGDGQRIIWGPFSADIFRGNPNIAPPGSERADDIEWIRYHKGHRIYSYSDGKRWVWNYDFRTKPGEVFGLIEHAPNGAIVIEPNVAVGKSSARNRQWPNERFQYVTDALIKLGHRVIQPLAKDPGFRLAGAQHITATFRQALALQKAARLFIGPHGGLDHGAAAVGVPAVILFGGWAPPSVIGYATHINLTGGADACGSLFPCQHCTDAMNRITVDEVVTAAQKLLG